MFRRWLFWPLFAAIMGFAVGGSFVAALQQSIVDEHKQPAEADGPYEQPGIPAASPSSPEHQAKREQKSRWYDPIFNHLTDWLLVLFNGVLATFTVRLFYATSGLVDAAAADQRAWVNASDLIIDSQVIFRESAGNIAVSVKITNLGKSPALRIHTAMEMIYEADDAPAAVRTLSAHNRTVDIVHWTRTLLPGDSYRREWGFTIQPPAKGSTVLPTIIGCVTYRTTDQSIHQTGFVFDLFECLTNEVHKFFGGIRVDVPTYQRRIGWNGGAGGFAD